MEDCANNMANQNIFFTGWANVKVIQSSILFNVLESFLIIIEADNRKFRYCTAGSVWLN